MPFDAPPLYIQVNPRDNVAIVVSPDGARRGRELIPQSHKIALRDLAPGQPVLRYGATIGYANRPIAADSWVREEMLDEPAPPSLDDLPLATETPQPLPPLTGYTFEGYPNDNGTVGTRNILAITTTVQCVAPTVDYAVRRIKAELLPRYPNVDDAVAITHSYGCGVAIDAPGAAIPIRTLKNISLNPNAGGQPLVISLGCEKLQPRRMFGAEFPILEDGGIIRLQDKGGFAETVSAILDAAEKRLSQLNRRVRRTCPASDLIVGLQCGGSDAFSGVTCNPAAGFAADLLVRAGATVLFSEVTEIRDAVHLLTPRAINEQVARDLIREMRWYDDYLAAGLADRSANTTPGNKRGGLANIVENGRGRARGKGHG
jgi:galactarate dehydratase